MSLKPPDGETMDSELHKTKILLLLLLLLCPILTPVWESRQNTFSAMLCFAEILFITIAISQRYIILSIIIAY